MRCRGSRKFIDSEVVQRWASTIATILFPVLILPSAVEDASALNWALLLIVIGGSVAFLRPPLRSGASTIPDGKMPDLRQSPVTT